MGSRAQALKARTCLVALLIGAMAQAACATDDSVAGQGSTAASETPPVIEPIAPIGDETADAKPDDEAPVCAQDVLHLRGPFGQARFTVDVADTPEERAKGLMFVEKMPMSRGMLFAYPSERPVAFWMKNTLIPLDMIFADQQGVVVDVHENAVPGDLTSIPSDAPAQYVLEINGGMSRLLGIKPGAEIAHPAIENAAWRCR